MTASPTGTVYGQSVTFKATVAVVSPVVNAPTGTVTFKDGSTVLGTEQLSTSGSVTTATFTTSKLAIGTHSIVAVYGGDTDDLTSTSAALSFIVGNVSSDVQLDQYTPRDGVVWPSSSITPDLVNQAIDMSGVPAVSQWGSDAPGAPSFETRSPGPMDRVCGAVVSISPVAGHVRPEQTMVQWTTSAEDDTDSPAAGATRKAHDLALAMLHPGEETGLAGSNPDA